MLISTTTNTPDLQVHLTGYRLTMTVEFSFYRLAPIAGLPEDVQRTVSGAVERALSLWVDPDGDPGAATE